MTDRLTDEQIETLADQWPWELELVAEALRIAEREGWPLDDTVRAMDALAETGAEDPVPIVEAAIPHIRRDNAFEAIVRAFRRTP